jgi:hypothetical protein
MKLQGAVGTVTVDVQDRQLGALVALAACFS